MFQLIFFVKDLSNLTTADPIEKFQNIFHAYLKDYSIDFNDHNKGLRFGKILLASKTASNAIKSESVGELFYSKIIEKVSIECLIEEILKKKILNYDDLFNFLKIDLTSCEPLEKSYTNVEHITPQISALSSTNVGSFYPFLLSKKLSFDFFNANSFLNQ